MTFSELPHVRDTCTILSLHPLTDFIFSFASTATKKISESVVETAQTIKKTVEEGKIDNIIDKVWFLTLLRQVLHHLEAIMPQCVEVSGMSQGLSHLCIFRLFWEISRRSKKSLSKRRNPKNQVKPHKLFIPPGSVQYFWEIKFRFASSFPVNWFIRSCSPRCGQLSSEVNSTENAIVQDFRYEGLLHHLHRTSKPYLSFLLLAAFPSQSCRTSLISDSAFWVLLDVLQCCSGPVRT